MKSGRAVLFGIPLFCLAIFTAIQVNIYNKVSKMPAEIHYQIVLYENVWPDQLYVESYKEVKPAGYELEGYWTFEPGTHLFAGSKWIWHPETFTLANVNSIVKEIKR